jgi:hypothetical protein
MVLGLGREATDTMPASIVSWTRTAPAISITSKAIEARCGSRINRLIGLRSHSRPWSGRA